MGYKIYYLKICRRHARPIKRGKGMGREGRLKEPKEEGEGRGEHGRPSYGE